MSDPNPEHAQKMSEFTDLLNHHGAASAEVQMYLATCEDPAVVELCRTAIRVQRYLRENMVLAMGVPLTPGNGPRK